MTDTAAATAAPATEAMTDAARLRRLDETADAAAAVLSQLDEVGYAVVPSALSDGEVDALRAELAPYLAVGPEGRNDFEGFATQRVYGLIVKSRAFDRLVLDPLVLAVAERCLGPAFLLSASLAINVCPGESQQTLHYDDAFYPIPRPRPPISLSTLWTIDGFTPDNGGTVLCPGSHRWGDGPFRADAHTFALTAPPGSLVFYLGTLVHAGGANSTSAGRLAISLQYAAAWARQQENFVLELGLDGSRALPERLQELVGFNIHSLLMGMVDGRHPKKLLVP